LGRPEWSVCASSSTLQVEETASWLFTIDRTAIASHVFNADHRKIAADDRLPNLDHREDKADRGEGRVERPTAKRPDRALGLPGADQFDGIIYGIAGARNLPRSLRLCDSDSGFDSASCSRILHSLWAVPWKAINPASAINSWRHTGPSCAATSPHSAVTSMCVTAATSKPAPPITHAARAATPSSRRMHANAGSRRGNRTYSRPTTLNSQPNHARRMSHTITTITITVPNKPIPNIAPPGGHIGHQSCPYRHDRPGFRLSSDQNQAMTRIIEMGPVLRVARSFTPRNHPKP
jgi:hypothetical protein